MSHSQAKNKAGYALVWVISALVIVLILAVGLLSLSQSFAKRSINEYAESQAYLTARAACDGVCQYLFDVAAPATEASREALIALLPTEARPTVEVSDFSWQSPGSETQAMEQVLASYSLSTAGERQILTVRATATVGDRTSSVSREIEIKTTSSGEGGESGGEGEFDSTIGLHMSNSMTLGSAPDYLFNFQDGNLRVEGCSASLRSLTLYDKFFGFLDAAYDVAISHSLYTGEGKITYYRNLVEEAAHQYPSVNPRNDYLEVSVAQGLKEYAPVSVEINREGLAEVPANKKLESGKDYYLEAANGLSLASLTNSATGTANPGRLYLYVPDGVTLTIPDHRRVSDGSTLYFIHAAPGSTIIAEDGAALYGVIYGETMICEGDFTLKYRQPDERYMKPGAGSGGGPQVTVITLEGGDYRYE